MNRLSLLFFLLLLSASPSKAQLIRLSPNGDSTRSITLEGYADVYFGFDFNQPADANRPYAVSQSRHNEFNINLAYLSIKYNSERARATFTPGFGTYMNGNYATERQTLQYLVEANVGVKPFKNRDIWIDAGVFGAPYTTEGAVAHDQMLYTRSFGAEYSPYYLTGIRLGLPLSKEVKLYLYLVNGWQIIQDVNSPLAFGSALEWKPNDKVTLNWSTYAGDENSASQPLYHRRLFSDLYCLYNVNPRLALSADVYAGRQHLADSMDDKSHANWYQGNLNARYSFGKGHSIAARAEYFSDAHAVMVLPVTGVAHFDCGSLSLGYNATITSNVSFHLEGRYYVSGNKVFFDSNQQPVSTDALLIGGLTAKF